jgi:hypothetical protein
MYVAYVLHDDTKDCVILSRQPNWLSFHNHESVWMVPGTISADDGAGLARPWRHRNQSGGARCIAEGGADGMR